MLWFHSFSRIKILGFGQITSHFVFGNDKQHELVVQCGLRVTDSSAERC